MNGPRVLLLFADDKFRIVELANGNKVLERYDGADAMGTARWGEVRLGDAERVSRVLRDWMFGHLAVCTYRKEQEPHESQ